MTMMVRGWMAVGEMISVWATRWGQAAVSGMWWGALSLWEWAADCPQQDAAAQKYL